jgi:hypothetical protein
MKLHPFGTNASLSPIHLPAFASPYAAPPPNTPPTTRSRSRMAGA